MRLIHALWEQRNMGVDCIEVIVEQNDTVQDLKRERKYYETEYTVIKVPVKMMDICWYLQLNGYLFIETMTMCHHEVKLPELNRIQKRITDEVKYAAMNEDDKEELFAEIDAGLFQYDRVSMDPYFTRKQANDRYKGWIQEEIQRGTEVYKMEWKGRSVGFFTYKDLGKGIFFPFLGGVYAEYLKSGLGTAMNYCEIKEAVRRKGKKMKSAYSSNNRGAASVHMSLGYILDEQTYVFVGHF